MRTKNGCWRCRSRRTLPCLPGRRRGGLVVGGAFRGGAGEVGRGHGGARGSRVALEQRHVPGEHPRAAGHDGGKDMVQAFRGDHVAARRARASRSPSRRWRRSTSNIHRMALIPSTDQDAAVAGGLELAVGERAQGSRPDASSGRSWVLLVMTRVRRRVVAFRQDSRGSGWPVIPALDGGICATRWQPCLAEAPKVGGQKLVDPLEQHEPCGSPLGIDRERQRVLAQGRSWPPGRPMQGIPLRRIQKATPLASQPEG